jgi:hypothetical protein
MAKTAIRPIRIEGNVAYVPLTQGYEAIIDVEDVPLVEGYNWRAMTTGRSMYAARSGPRAGKERPLIMMHRVIAGDPEGLLVDHKDGNGMNNRRLNLRSASNTQNQHNAKISKVNTSGSKGVHWRADIGKWAARIRVNGNRKTLGFFSDIQSAAAAYEAASKQFHGEFGRVK